MRISDWSSDVCSSDLSGNASCRIEHRRIGIRVGCPERPALRRDRSIIDGFPSDDIGSFPGCTCRRGEVTRRGLLARAGIHPENTQDHCRAGEDQRGVVRSEEHTSELQSLMRISYAVFCLKKKKQTKTQ